MRSLRVDCSDSIDTQDSDSLLLGISRYYYSLFASYYRLPEILMSIVE